MSLDVFSFNWGTNTNQVPELCLENWISFPFLYIYFLIVGGKLKLGFKDFLDLKEIRVILVISQK